MSQPDMLNYFDQLENQSKAIKEEVLKLCWYMRGSISYNEGMMLSPDERTMISKIVKENLETTKKSRLTSLVC